MSRATRDIDLLVIDPACLAPALWAPLEPHGIAAMIRRGEADDPLAGVVRLSAPGESPVDLIVGRPGWPAGVVERAARATIEGVPVAVAGAADLILLKLYAAGPQDAWDIEQLLASGDRTALVADVQSALPALPEDSRRLWARILGPR